MVGEISGVTKTEVLRAIRNRYREASRKDKGRMLDEFVALVGCHRKHAVRLLRQDDKLTARSVPKGQRIYDEAVREALTVVWEASDRICGKRLKAALPSMVEYPCWMSSRSGLIRWATALVPFHPGSASTSYGV